MRFPSGLVMRARREELGLPRSVIATATMRGEEMVRRWERGDAIPPTDVLVRIAATLNLPMSKLGADQ